jgi:hypothetical protein
MEGATIMDMIRAILSEHLHSDEMVNDLVELIEPVIEKERDESHTAAMSLAQQVNELRAQVATLAKSDVEKLPKINPAAQDLIGTTITELDGTGWLAAETPIGRIGSYSSLTALFMAIIYEYQKREERAAQYVRGLENAATYILEQHRGNPDDAYYPVPCGLIRMLAEALAAKEQQG